MADILAPRTHDGGGTTLNRWAAPRVPRLPAVWMAPRANGPVRAVIAVPGSKSLTNRALILAALASEPTTIRGALLARDSELMMRGLRALGATVSVEAAEAGANVVVQPPREFDGGIAIDCGWPEPS